MASHVFARSLSAISVVVLLLPCTALADFDSGSDGSDGAFAPEFKTVIDLSLAATASWDTPSPVPGQGVYDPDKWAVVFKYSTIDVPVGVTVSFTNHPSGAPVIWLGSGDVTIAGEVNVNGVDAGGSDDPSAYATSGPGGFAGGARYIWPPDTASGGFGPGGADPSGNGTAGQYALAYGDLRIAPLIGGSGGSGNTSGAPRGGGAGAGAILIASSTQILLPAGGAIRADGGGSSFTPGHGSGGGIRLIADAIGGDGQLRALGGNSGTNVERIRVDADIIDLTDLGNPPWTTDFTTFPVFPPDNEPILRITQIEDESIPADPIAGIPSTEVTIDTGNVVVVHIEAENIPSGTTVEVRVIPARGFPFSVTSTPLAVGKGGIFTAIANVTFPSGKAEIHLKANWTP